MFLLRRILGTLIFTYTSYFVFGDDVPGLIYVSLNHLMYSSVFQMEGSQVIVCFSFYVKGKTVFAIFVFLLLLYSLVTEEMVIVKKESCKFLICAEPLKDILTTYLSGYISIL